MERLNAKPLLKVFILSSVTALGFGCASGFWDVGGGSYVPTDSYTPSSSRISDYQAKEPMEVESVSIENTPIDSTKSCRIPIEVVITGDTGRRGSISARLSTVDHGPGGTGFQFASFAPNQTHVNFDIWCVGMDPGLYWLEVKIGGENSGKKVLLQASDYSVSSN
jgi:hypothetical protein